MSTPMWVESASAVRGLARGYSCGVDDYDLAEAAERSGVDVEEFGQLDALGIIRPHADQRFTPGDLRRATLVSSLVAAGVPLPGLAAAIRAGAVSFDFLD